MLTLNLILYVFCEEIKLKKNILRGILLILLLWTFAMIFGFSSQNAEQSGGLSKKITQNLVNKIPNIEEQKQEQIMDRMEKVIRKIAHFSIYTLVGFLLMAFVSTYNIPEKTRIISSLLVGMIYASSDEIHQRFVAGRSAQVTDVMLDTLGVLFGILILMLVLQIADRKKKKAV